MFKTLGSLGLAAVAVLATSQVATAAAPTYDVRPGALPQGAAPSAPVMVDDTIVDGDAQIEVTGYEYPLIIGESASGYVVGGIASGRVTENIIHVDPDGSQRELLPRADAWGSQVSDDGTTLAAWRYTRQGTTTVWTLDIATGDVTARRHWDVHVTPLDVEGNRVMLGNHRRTMIWNTARDRINTLVSGSIGYYGDLSSGHYAVFTEDPYNGGRTEILKLGEIDAVWASRTQRVVEISPDGTRMATVHKLSDGPGYGEVSLRRMGGRALAHFRASGYIAGVEFEDDNSLLMDAVGPRKEAWVRGDADGLERATPLRDAREV